MATDPYAAPKARVEDVRAGATEGEFIAGGQAVAANHGWEWITRGWGLFKEQPGMWILILVVWLVIVIAIALTPYIGGLVGNVLFPVFAGGIMLGCRELDRGGALAFGHLFAGFGANFGKLAAVGLYYFVVLVVVALAAGRIAGLDDRTALGLFTGIVPVPADTVPDLRYLLAVLIVFAVMLPVLMSIWFAPALIVFHDGRLGETLKASFSACLKNIVPFLLYGAILLVFMFAASLPILLGWLVLGPTMFASVYASYKDIHYAD
jgi:hypothetical protein